MNEHLDATGENFSDEELDIEKTLRPQHFDDFTGQDQALDNLRIFVEAANQRQEALDHTLFHCHPGLGKTTFAYILALELHVNLCHTSGRVGYNRLYLAGLLTNLVVRDVLFSEEIHCLSPIVEG